MIRLIRSEVTKIRTTNMWWVFGILLIGGTALAFAINALQAHFFLHTSARTASEMGQGVQQQVDPAYQAGNLYTSGQYMGLVFVMVLGALVVTNEFFHQTATTTFLTSPKRTEVILAKLTAAIGIGAAFWFVATVIDLAAGVLFLQTEGFDAQLGVWSVWRSILLNLLAYAIWTIVGVGLGALIRSQIATVIIGVVVYFVTGTVAQGVATILDQAAGWHWLPKWIVALPATASQLMITGTTGVPGEPPQWVGAVILVGWGVVAGIIGTLITRTRDIT